MPAGVNFSALLSRLSTICLTFWRSLVNGGQRHAACRHGTVSFERRMIGSSSDITSLDQLRDLEAGEVERHPARFDAGDVEDLVDDGRAGAGRSSRCASRLLALDVGHRSGHALQQHVGVAEDRVERRPELVRHVREELRLERRRLLELDVPVGAAARSAAPAPRWLPGPFAPARPTLPSAARRAGPFRSPRVRSWRMVTTAVSSPCSERILPAIASTGDRPARARIDELRSRRDTVARRRASARSRRRT